MTNLTYPDLTDLERHLAVLELIPDTHAWVKDTQGRFVYGNRLFFERFGYTEMAGLLGKTDFDIAPQNLAEQYVLDDTAVLEGGTVTDRLELIVNNDSTGDWFLTSKWQVVNFAGEVLGTFGMSRHLNRAQGTSAQFEAIRAPVDYIHQNFASALSVASLASASNISVSALERRFRRYLNKTPRQYITEIRLENAQQMLRETEKAIGTIALETGFADHSHFTRAYTRYYGLSPREARRQDLA